MRTRPQHTLQVLAQTPRTLGIFVAIVVLAVSVSVVGGGEARAEGPTVGYKGGFFIASPDGLYKLTIGARVQTRFTFEKDDGGESFHFSIPRARLALKGNVFSKDLKFKFQTDFGKGFASLKDFYADYRFIKDWLHIRVGQWKKPFSRQQLTSSSKLAFVDRGITDKAFGAGRDIGLMFHNGNPMFEWAFGLFNGTSDKASLSASADADGDVSGKFTNVPDKFNPMAVVRLAYNHNDMNGYDSADLKGGDVRFAVGVSAKLDAGLDQVGDKGALAAELDFVLKVSGFSASAAVFLNAPLGGDGVDLLGTHVELGQSFAERFGLALRYERLDETATDGAVVQEIGGGFSFYLFGHKVKWQTDAYGVITENGPATLRVSSTNFVFRSQLQLGF